MNKNRWIFIAITLALLLAVTTASRVKAVGPILPIADTYININDADPTNVGAEAYMLLSASNTNAGCVPATYLWFRFDVPNPDVTIDYAELAVPFENLGGAASLDMQLLSSPVTNWVENGPNGITWTSQPALDAQVLASAASVPPGADARFISSDLANYLEGKRGQVVTLVVRANCAGSVGTSANRVIRTREHASGSGVELTLRNGGPNSVRLISFASPDSPTFPSVWVGLLIFGLAFGYAKIRNY
jgi:hypothetical protein